ncbi:MAG: hypothetical protein HYT73_02055 [Candidatus Aenigmarchaeota archaeon]|nr:hypothetical protein [Candidatus Aenigmarchaeota archaeon]
MNKALYAIATFLLIAGIAYAAIPTILNFQGRLTDSSNNPINGTHNFTMRIYDAYTGGNLLWTETQRSINVSSGVFTVELGSVTSINLTFSADYWLQAEVTGENLTPRRRIASNAYAFRANISDNLTCTSCVKSGAIESVDATKVNPGTFGGSGNYTFPQNVSAKYFVGDGQFLINTGTNISVLHGKDPAGVIVPLAATAEGILLLNVTQAESVIAQTLSDWATGNDLILLRYFRIGSSNLLTANTSTSRVGIGTNSPATELEVIGNITATNVTATYFIGSGALLTNITNVSLLFAYNSSVFTPVQTTTDGVLRLQVDEAQASGLATGATGTNLTLTSWINVSGTARNSSFQDVQIFGTLYGGSPLRISGSLNVTGDLNVTGGRVSFPSTEVTTFNAGINAINANFTGSINLATGGGRVGIGATNPSSALEIRGSRPSIIINNSAGSGVMNLAWYNSIGSHQNGSVRLQYSVDDFFLYVDNLIPGNSFGTAFRGNSASGSTGSVDTTIMTILNGGNVGIGTTGPGAKLHILGSLIVQNSTNSLWGDESDGAVSNMADSDTDATTIVQSGTLSATHNRIYRATGNVTISQAITVLPQSGQTRGVYPTTQGAAGIPLGAILSTTGSKGIPRTMKPGGESNTSNGGIIQILAKGHVVITAQINASGNYTGADGGGGGGLVVIVSNGTISGTSAIIVAGADGGNGTANARGGAGGYSGEPGGHAGWGGSGGGASETGGSGSGGAGFIAGKAGGAGGGANGGGGGGGSIDNAGADGSGTTGGAGGAGGSYLNTTIIQSVLGFKSRNTLAKSNNGTSSNGIGGVGGVHGGGGGGAGYVGSPGGQATNGAGSGGGGAGDDGGGAGRDGGNGGNGGSDLYTLSSYSVYAGLPGGQGGGGGGAANGGTGGTGGSGATGIIPFVSGHGAGAGRAGASGSNGGAWTGGAGGAGGNGGGAAGMVIMIAPSVSYSGTVTGRLVIIEGAEAHNFIRGYFTD